MRNWYKQALAEYWGSKASGCLFICKEDQTVLLFLRSPDVEQPRTWGITGGAVPVDGEDEGFMESDLFEDDGESEDPHDEIFEDSARTETREETGTFPSESEMILSTDFSDGNFTYRTFIYNLPLSEKEAWSSTIELNWENDSYAWFPINQLPQNLHFGVSGKLEEIKKALEDQPEMGPQIFAMKMNPFTTAGVDWWKKTDKEKMKQYRKEHRKTYDQLDYTDVFDCAVGERLDGTNIEEMVGKRTKAYYDFWEAIHPPSAKLMCRQREGCPADGSTPKPVSAFNLNEHMTD